MTESDRILERMRELQIEIESCDGTRSFALKTMIVSIVVAIAVGLTCPWYYNILPCLAAFMGWGAFVQSPVIAKSHLIEIARLNEQRLRLEAEK